MVGVVTVVGVVEVVAEPFTGLTCQVLSPVYPDPVGVVVGYVVEVIGTGVTG